MKIEAGIFKRLFNTTLQSDGESERPIPPERLPASPELSPSAEARLGSHVSDADRHLPPIEYAQAGRTDSRVVGRRLANAAFVCAGLSVSLIVASALGQMAFNALVPSGRDADEVPPTIGLAALKAIAELGVFSFATLLAGCIFAIVGLCQHRNVRTWLSLAANLAVPAAMVAIM